MTNRWTILLAGCLIQIILGGIYAWSTFVPYLEKDYELNSGQCGFIFGLTILVFTAVMVFAGRLLTKRGPRWVAVIASLLFMSGYLLASFSQGSFVLLLLSFSGIAGAGIGFGYVCPLSVSMKWFPDKQGLVTGVTVAGFGAGAVLLSALSEYFLAHGTDLLLFFRWYGLISGGILFAAALCLRDPEGSQREAITAPLAENLRSTSFLVCCVGIFAGTFAGLLIIGNLTPIVIKAGLTEAEAAVAVSVFALGNGLGRIVWGKLFDHLGYKSIPLSLGLFVPIAGLLLVPLPRMALLLSVLCIGFSFGSNFVLYASAISRHFGTASFPRLYPICFVTYGVAGLIGPGLGGYLADATASYTASIYLCMGLILVATLWTWKKLPHFS